MKAVIAIFFGLIFSLSQDAQKATLEGDWQGSLNVQGTSLRLVFHVKNEEGKWSSTMDSPDQNAFGLKMDETVVDGGKIKMTMNQIQGTYEGTLKEGKIEGKWSQSGQSFDINLQRVKKGSGE